MIVSPLLVVIDLLYNTYIRSFPNKVLLTYNMHLYHHEKKHIFFDFFGL